MGETAPSVSSNRGIEVTMPTPLVPPAARRRLAALVLAVSLLGLAAEASAGPADKNPTVTGTVSRVVASQRTVEVTLPDGTSERFLWNSETKINGTLTPGAAVTVRYSSGADGSKLALQITVARS
jgi:hypothetical protein